MTDRRGRRFDAVDEAMLQLVRLVLDDAWTAVTAAANLRERVHDEAVLRRARSRVSWALSERPSRVGERAITTLDVALILVHQEPVDLPLLADESSAGSCPRG